jgi:hypothetical protein
MFSASLQKKIKNDISRSKNDFLEKIIKRKLNYHVKNKLSIKKKKKKKQSSYGESRVCQFKIGQ